jgi:hypothetical protein
MEDKSEMQMTDKSRVNHELIKEKRKISTG